MIFAIWTYFVTSIFIIINSARQAIGWWHATQLAGIGVVVGVIFGALSRIRHMGRMSLFNEQGLTYLLEGMAWGLLAALLSVLSMKLFLWWYYRQRVICDENGCFTPTGEPLDRTK